MKAAFCSHTWWLVFFAGSWNVCDAPRTPSSEKPMIHGVTNCTMETPKLPMPACRPSAVPCLRRGKKYDVLGMKPENAPPPMPDRNARIRNVV